MSIDNTDKSSMGMALDFWDRDSADALHRSLADIDDGEWFDVVRRSATDPFFAGHLLPRFIDAETQAAYVGTSGEVALLKAELFLATVLDYMRNSGIALGGNTRVIDFGSGWGRFTRYMLKYVHPDNLFGLDVSGKMVEHCRKSFGMATFLKVDPMPPCDFRDNFVDLVYGYSVFSHLSSDCADAWIDEFARITRPGGLVILTTRARSFIDYCKSFREGDPAQRSHYLADCFQDSQNARKDYDEGRFVHEHLGMLDGTYGESVIPRGYIEQNWLHHFELIAFIEETGHGQSVFTLQRRG